MTKSKTIILLLLSSFFLVACHSDVVYSSWQSVPEQGWSADSAFRFDFDIADTTAAYDIVLHVRHRDSYPYQNMWLFVSDSMVQDTIEFYLADARGLWLGNGRNGLTEMPVLFQEEYRFAGSHQHLSILQGMREPMLQGVSDVGISIVYHGKE